MEIKLNEKYFPDEEFRAYLKDTFLWEEGQELSKNEYLKIQSIDLDPRKYKITSLKGIEHFTELKELYVDQQELLTELDIDFNEKLEYFSAFKTNLKKISFKNNLKLLGIDMTHNTTLTSLDLSDHKNLKFLNIQNSNIFYLNLKNCQYLEYLDVQNCKNLNDFIVDGCDNLESLDVGACPRITYLNLNKCKNLRELIIHYDLSVKNLECSECEYLHKFYVDMSTILS